MGGVPVPVTAPPLRYKPLQRALVRRRLPRYHAVAFWLSECISRSHITYLWREVFAAEPPPGSAFDAQVEFVGRVCQELFPVDTGAMDDLLTSGADPMEYPIMVGGWGVPWEIEGFHGVHPADRPMVAVVYTAGAGRCVAVLGYCREDLWLEEPIADWWAGHGLDCAASELPDRLALRLRSPRLRSGQAGLAWAADPERAEALLRRLEPPLDGLATLYRCVLKGTGNPFLDLPFGAVQGEYLMGGDFDYFWDPGDVRTLARRYAEVRDEVARLDRYYEWFEDTPGAEQHVVETLTRLEETYGE